MSESRGEYWSNYGYESVYSKPVRNHTQTRKAKEIKASNYVSKAANEEVVEEPEISASEENNKKMDPKYDSMQQDIGKLRDAVVHDLFEELYIEISDDVRQQLEAEKPQLVKEISDELKQKVKTEIIKGIKGKGEDSAR